MKITYMNKEKMKKIMILLMTTVLILALLAGCTHKSSVEDQSMMEQDSTGETTQVVEAQNNTNVADEVLDAVIFIDEKLDENLFISAELKMPKNNLYEYATQLKNFDYDKALEAMQQNAEGTIGGEMGSLTYQRNDIANHLDTYCSYAGEWGLANDRDLSFMSREDAVTKIQSLMEQLEVGGELGTPNVTAMDKTDFENVKKVIMEDDDYQKVLSAKNYGSDAFDEDLEVYRMEFPMEVNGIHVYGRNDPVFRQTRDAFVAYPSSITVLLSNSGIEMITIIGALEPYENQQKEADIIGAEGIKNALMAQFGDVILPFEYKAVNIWIEYFPLLAEGSFTDVDLIPAWCIDFEINGDTVEDSCYTLRFNAITGEVIS